MNEESQLRFHSSKFVGEINIIEEYREQTISRRRLKEEFLQKEQEVQNFLFTSIMQDLEASYQPKKFIKALQR